MHFTSTLSVQVYFTSVTLHNSVELCIKMKNWFNFEAMDQNGIANIKVENTGNLYKMENA